MKINVRALFTSVALVCAASYIICAFFVAVAPETTTRTFSFVFHIDLTGMARTITWERFFGGLVSFSVGIALHFAAAGWLYNRWDAGKQ